MDRTLKTIVASQIKRAVPRLLDLAFTGAGELSKIESDVISNSLKEYVRGSNQAAKNACHFRDSISEIRSMLSDKWLAVKKEVEIASIEHPFLELRLADTLGIKKIKYNLVRRPCGHVLEVQIIPHVWMQGPLTVENVDKVTGLVPYFRHRPDRLDADMPEYHIVRKW